MTGRSTLDGYVPQVGDVVWQRLYSPTQPSPDSTIQQRVEAGPAYRSRLMILRGIMHDYDVNAAARELGADLPPRLATRWALQDADPQQRRDECRGFSWVESDWCVLELVERPAQQLDLLQESAC